MLNQKNKVAEEHHNINQEVNTNHKILKGKWYSINCYSGHEEKVREDLLQRIETLNMKDYIFDIRIVKNNEVSKKTKKLATKNSYQGYLFVNMIMTDDAWYIVRNTPRVTGFVGSSGNWSKPLPLTKKEANEMLKRSSEKEVKATKKKTAQLFYADFKEGDTVRILSGAFEGKEGDVITLDFSKGVATVNIEVFAGRMVPVEAEFSYCEKI